MLQKEDTDWVKKCMEYKVEGSRPRGRPNRTWREVMQKDCQAHKLNREDAMEEGDKGRLVIRIGEWVNVSSGTGLTRVVPDKGP